MHIGRRLLDLDSWSYLASGLLGRLQRRRACPCCGGDGISVDSKFFHTLHECSTCGILFRYPYETSLEMASFYQADYNEPSLTTELPSDEAIAEFIRVDFRGSAKDFSYITSVLRAVGLRAGDRLLEFGANWGYASYQFRKTGFVTESYELSVPRARFGRKLGLEIVTDVAQLRGPFDAVYSCHVLEHVPNPRQVLLDQLALTKPGGLVVAHTPNGSEAFCRSDPSGFSRTWGKAHPVLLNQNFIHKCFPNFPTLVTSCDNPGVVGQWDRKSSVTGELSGSGLFFAIVVNKAT